MDWIVSKKYCLDFFSFLFFGSSMLQLGLVLRTIFCSGMKEDNLTAICRPFFMFYFIECQTQNLFYLLNIFLLQWTSSMEMRENDSRWRTVCLAANSMASSIIFSLSRFQLLLWIPRQKIIKICLLHHFSSCSSFSFFCHFKKI
jgi:hypothetical protein